jgi:hypothetical protein
MFGSLLEGRRANAPLTDGLYRELEHGYYASCITQYKVVGPDQFGLS